jgi:hypothetical protein
MIGAGIPAWSRWRGRGHHGGVEQGVATSLGQAREAVSKAALAYDEALSELEGAASRGPDAVEAAHARLREASTQMARAQAEVSALSTPAETSPSGSAFEVLLRSGSVSFDLRGEVMASIVAYQAATSATLSGPSVYGEHPPLGWASSLGKATTETTAA